MMRNLFSTVVWITSFTCKIDVLPNTVQYAVPESSKARILASSAGSLLGLQVAPKAVIFAFFQGKPEKVLVLRVRAWPAAFDVGHAQIVETPSNIELVVARKGDIFTLRP